MIWGWTGSNTYGVSTNQQRHYIRAVALLFFDVCGYYSDSGSYTHT